MKFFPGSQATKVARRLAAAFASATLVAGIGLMAAPSASAASPIVGYVDSWTQSRSADGKNVIGFNGWTLDTRSPSTRINYDATVNDRGYQVVPTYSNRPDVNQAYGTTGTHGFVGSVRVGAGTQKVCIRGLNLSNLAGGPLTNGCKTFFFFS